MKQSRKSTIRIRVMHREVESLTKTKPTGYGTYKEPILDTSGDKISQAKLKRDRKVMVAQKVEPLKSSNVLAVVPEEPLMAGPVPQEPVKKVTEQLIKLWEGDVDPLALNDTMLEMMRARDAKSHLTEAKLAKKLHMDRKHLHKVHTDLKVVTIPLLAQWAIGWHIDPAFFLRVGEMRLEPQKKAS